MPGVWLLQTPRCDFLTIDLEPEIDANRANRRLEPQAESRCGAHPSEVDVRGLLEDVASVEEPDHADAAHQWHAQFGIQDDHPVAADRESVRDHLGCAERIEGKAADGRVAAGEETLARRQLDAGLLSRECGGQTEARTAGEH